MSTPRAGELPQLAARDAKARCSGTAREAKATQRVSSSGRTLIRSMYTCFKLLPAPDCPTTTRVSSGFANVGNEFLTELAPSEPGR